MPELTNSLDIMTTAEALSRLHALVDESTRTPYLPKRVVHPGRARVASVVGLAAALVEPWQVFKAAVLPNAAALVVAHNHPSGNPEPSR